MVFGEILGFDGLNLRYIMKKTYCFDDVLLIPQYSDIGSRSEVDISSDLDENFKFSLPVISSPMDTVTETSMAVALATAGGLGIIHRYNTIEEQAALVHAAARCGAGQYVGATVGASGDYEERACALYDAGARIICIDVAHGHHSLVKKALSTLREIMGSKIHIMAGNVATLEGFDALASWGADSIRVGIGGGSICSTRMVTGHGVSTFQSIIDCAQSSYDVKIIADGGVKTTGDMVKAYAAGADFVMIGSMLAGTSETPGEVFFGKANKKYKVYRGMASASAQNAWRSKTSTPEGISTTIPFRGSVKRVLEDITGGLRSGLSYSGARSLGEFRSKASFIAQSSAGQLESNTHILWRRK
jgi:IMP dehydrogenase